jgi:hypothetical protein
VAEPSRSGSSRQPAPRSSSSCGWSSKCGSGRGWRLG